MKLRAVLAQSSSHASLTLAVRKPCLGPTCTPPTPDIAIYLLFKSLRIGTWTASALTAKKEGNVTAEIASCLQLPSTEWPGYKANIVTGSRQVDRVPRGELPLPQIWTLGAQEAKAQMCAWGRGGEILWHLLLWRVATITIFTALSP